MGKRSISIDENESVLRPAITQFSQLIQMHKHKPTLQPALRFWVVFTAIFAVVVIAQAATLPSFPSPSVWADSEGEFEASFAAFNGVQNVFKISFEFNASLSNNLQVGVWDGSVACGETEAVVGWDCGVLFVECGGVRGVCGDAQAAERLEVSLVVRLSAEGKPLDSVITANGAAVEFFGADGSPVVFGFSTGWDSVRVLSRGAGIENERVSFGLATDPAVLVIR